MFNVRQANSCCCNCQKIWQLFGVQSLVHFRNFSSQKLAFQSYNYDFSQELLALGQWLFFVCSESGLNKVQTTLIVLLAVAILAGMAYLHRKNWGFTKLVFLSLVVGIVFGVSIQLMFGAKSDIVKNSIDWISIVGDGYVSLLQMLVIPLIFVSLVGAFTQLKMTTKIRKIATSVLAILLGTTAVASFLGFSSVAVLIWAELALLKG